MGHAPVVESVLDLVGESPLVRLRMGGPASVWAKCEHLLPSGSLKDRVADAALARSGVARGGSVVVASSGSSAAALAVAAKLRGVKIVVAMPRSMALEKRSLLRALGVELVLTDAELAMDGARTRAAQIARERGLPSIDVGAEEGARATAEEIVRALGRVPDVLVVGVGSGATLRAMSGAMKAQGDVRVVGVAATSTTTRIAGLSVSSAADGADAIRTVDDSVAWHTSRRLAREEGLLVGPSAGACVSIACEVASALPSTASVCTLLADTGERYFSIAPFFPSEARP